MKKINIRGFDIPVKIEFDMVSKGKYWIQNFWGCQVRMEKSDNAIGWGDQWFVEVYHKRRESDRDSSWVATSAFHASRRDCVDYLLRIAKASLEGKPITFRHRVQSDSEGMWAMGNLSHPYFKTVLQPTRRRVNND